MAVVLVVLDYPQVSLSVCIVVDCKHFYRLVVRWLYDIPGYCVLGKLASCDANNKGMVMPPIITPDSVHDLRR